jgi:hypothetical protein
MNEFYVRTEVRGDWRLFVSTDWIISVTPPYTEQMIEAIKTARSEDEIASTLRDQYGVVYRFVEWR